MLCRSRGRGSVFSTTSAMQALGPFDISRMRSASRIDSSTSCVIMNTVWRVAAQMRTSSSWMVPRAGEPDQVDEFLAVQLQLNAVPRRPAALHGEGDVAHHREPGHQRVALE